MGVATVSVFAALVGGAILWRMRSVEGPPDTLDVLAASWIQTSPPKAQVVFRLRRVDGRPASQGVTVGLADEQAPDAKDDLKATGDSTAPTYHYTVTFKRRPPDPLVMRVTAHSDTVLAPGAHGVAKIVSPSRDLFTQQIVIPPMTAATRDKDESPH